MVISVLKAEKLKSEIWNNFGKKVKKREGLELRIWTSFL